MSLVERSEMKTSNLSNVLRATLNATSRVRVRNRSTYMTQKCPTCFRILKDADVTDA